MFIRLFADTTGSAASDVALEYMRSLMRVAPVRLITVTGPLVGRWMGYGQLLATPMLGDFVNCVACDPARWTWVERVPMGSKPIDIGEIGDGKELTVPAAPELASGRVELYTLGKRNVLFVIAPPRSKVETEAAKKYEVFVRPTVEPWLDGLGCQPIVIPVPVSDHAAMREVLGL